MKVIPIDSHSWQCLPCLVVCACRHTRVITIWNWLASVSCTQIYLWSIYRRATWLALRHPQDSDDFVLMWAIVVYCRLYKFPSPVYRQNTDTYIQHAWGQLTNHVTSGMLIPYWLKYLKSHDVGIMASCPLVVTPAIGPAVSLGMAGVHTLSLRWHWHGREQLLLNSCHNSDSR